MRFSAKFNVIEKTVNTKTRAGLVLVSIGQCRTHNGWVILLRVQMRAIKEGSSLD